ncbi:hypothetical protein DAI22_12g012700 [Oryza sativa Japonica Group]|nr:probable WRKY transcription factor 46 isoform X3 [Oryza sativa Japonica Group]KAF2906347.1 hypothetical protein DAI22_12g012700 [Oryza sativa Japonica Group]
MARRRVSAGAASTPIHQIGIQGRTTKQALHGCSVVIKSSTSVVGPYAWVRSGGGRNKLSVLTIGKRKGDKHIMDNHNLEEEAKESVSKRRKNAEHTGSTVAQAPHNDGHQWRKYGQKWISRAKHSRSYYRCANSKVQGCPATKTVQQMDSSGNGTSKLFNVDYYGQHTCRGDGIANPYVVDTAHHSMEPINQNECNSPTLEHEAHEVQDERFENLCMVQNMPEYLIDFELERAFEFIVNSPLGSEHWTFDDSIRCEHSPICIWG